MARMSLHSLSLTTLVGLLLSVQAFAKPDLPEGPVAQREMKGMSYEQLHQLNEKLDTNWTQIRSLITRTSNNNLDALNSVIALRDFEGTQENIEILIELVRSETKRLETGLARGEVFELALNILAEIGSSKPGRYIEELEDLQKEVAGRLGPHKIAPRLDAFFTQGIAAMRANSTPPVSIMGLMREADKKENGSKSRVVKIEDFLRKRIVGQPEVIDLILYLELRKQLYTKTRTEPEAIYLMGLPGTGKDTVGEAWVDALHGVKDAHKTHLYRLPVMKNRADLWKVMGSSTGFIGSEQFPPFLEFLVKHSDGKYKLDEVPGKPPTYRIIENPDYKGETLPGYSSPDKGVVFANEFHNWSREVKDEFLKQALEKGYFSINHPNGGLNEIYVPIRFLVASNEGIPLLAAREANGQRYGKALSIEQMQGKWNKVHDDKTTLKNEIYSTNGSANDPRGTGEAVGTSEELMNRIPDRNILILRPLAPNDLRQIADMKLKDLAETLQMPSELFDSVDLKWSNKVVEFVQDYQYVPEENARPVLGRVMSTVEEPILKAINSGKISANPSAKVKVDVDVELNSDKTHSLVIHVTQASGKNSTVKELITETLRDRPKPALSNERIDELSHFAEFTTQEVFGIESIVERMGDRVLSIANELTSGDTSRPANVLGVFGLTSTGKTELAKKTAKRILGNEDDLLTLDFSQIQTLHDFKTRILGLKDSRGNSIPSDFMKAFDRNNGLMVVAADEIANVKDPDLLRALYDFFREPVVSTFSDGKPRKMGSVFIIVTGNAGQEIFASIPRDIPNEVQMAAWKDISEKLSSDVNLQLSVLEKYLPWPLIARIGKNNIFFVPPHTYRSLRQLAQLKLSGALERIANTSSRRGWKVVFPDAEEYTKFIDVIIDEGFSLRYQGASIDAFVRDDFEETLKSLLLKNKVPSDSTVVIKFREKTDNSKEDKPGNVIYNVYVDGSANALEMKIRRPHVETADTKRDDVQMLVAYHEAGHSLVRQLLFEDVYTPEKISIIPGVAMINNNWVYYAGIAQAQSNRDINQTREYVIREIAVLTAGETAERLVSKGQQHSIGKVNDMERATRIARDAVLRYGLSEKWGTNSIPTGVQVSDYIQGLSESKKKLLESEVQSFVEEGRNLAESTLELNYTNGLLALGNLLGEKGEVNAEELAEFYKKAKLESADNASTMSKVTGRIKARVRGLMNPPSQKLDTEIFSSVPKPAKMANIEEIALARKAAMYASVAMPKAPPIGENDSYKNAVHTPKASCEPLLLKKKAG